MHCKNNKIIAIFEDLYSVWIFSKTQVLSAECRPTRLLSLTKIHNIFATQNTDYQTIPSQSTLPANRQLRLWNRLCNQKQYLR